MKKKCNECGHEQNVTTNAKRTTCSICDSKIPLRVLIASLLLIGAIGGSSAYADISAVVQENLTPVEQKVLDDIAAAKADGTYTQPPKVKLTATIQKYSEDVVISAPFPTSDVICGETIFKFGIPDMQCIVFGNIPKGMSVWDEADNKWIPEAVIQAEAELEAKTKAAELLTPEEKQFRTS